MLEKLVLSSFEQDTSNGIGLYCCNFTMGRYLLQFIVPVKCNVLRFWITQLQKYVKWHVVDYV